jgi:hypothetical protein
MDKYGIDYEKIFFLYFLKNPFFLQKIYKGFFSNQDLDFLAQVAKEFQNKFSEPPSKDQLKILIKNVKEKRELDEILEKLEFLIYF